MASLGTDFDALLTRGAVAALALAAGWALVVVAAVGLEALTDGRLRLAARTGCPRAVRVWLLAAFMAALAAAPVQAGRGADPGPHAAPPPGRGSQGVPVTSPGGVLDGLPLPDRQTGVLRIPAPAVETVVVRPGDTLWAIAHRSLPRGADHANIAAAVSAVYAANRLLIGSDPDLIRPGQRLALPHDLPRPHPLPEER